MSDVVKTAVPLRNWVAATSGYEIEHLFSRYCDTNGGRLAYYYYLLNKVYGSICQLTGEFITDVPGGQVTREVLNFMKVRGSVMRDRPSTVGFSGRLTRENSPTPRRPAAA